MTSRECPRLDEAPEGPQQLRDIVEMQTGGRLIEHEQRTAAFAVGGPEEARDDFFMRDCKRTALSAR